MLPHSLPAGPHQTSLPPLKFPISHLQHFTCPITPTISLSFSFSMSGEKVLLAKIKILQGELLPKYRSKTHLLDVIDAHTRAEKKRKLLSDTSILTPLSDTPSENVMPAKKLCSGMKGPSSQQPCTSSKTNQSPMARSNGKLGSKQLCKQCTSTGSDRTPSPQRDQKM